MCSWKETMESKTVRENGKGKGQNSRAADDESPTTHQIAQKKRKRQEYNKSPDADIGIHACELDAEETDLNALDGHSTLAVELISVAAVALLLAVLQALALVVLEHAVLTAVVTSAEAAVADNRLSAVLAVLERTADFLWGHAATQGQGEMKG